MVAPFHLRATILSASFLRPETILWYTNLSQRTGCNQSAWYCHLELVPPATDVGTTTRIRFLRISTPSRRIQIASITDVGPGRIGEIHHSRGGEAMCTSTMVCIPHTCERSCFWLESFVFTIRAMSDRHISPPCWRRRGRATRLNLSPALLSMEFLCLCGKLAQESRRLYLRIWNIIVPGPLFKHHHAWTWYSHPIIRLWIMANTELCQSAYIGFCTSSCHDSPGLLGTGGLLVENVCTTSKTEERRMGWLDHTYGCGKI